MRRWIGIVAAGLVAAACGVKVSGTTTSLQSADGPGGPVLVADIKAACADGRIEFSLRWPDESKGRKGPMALDTLRIDGKPSSEADRNALISAAAKVGVIENVVTECAGDGNETRVRFIGKAVGGAGEGVVVLRGGHLSAA